MMHPFNQKHDAVFCLSLERRTDRRKQAEEEFAKHGIVVEFINAVDGMTLNLTPTTSSDGLPVSRGDMGCTLSHLKMVTLAKERGYKSVLIFEDDVEFPNQLNLILVKYYLALPDDWDMFYLGGNHALPFEHVNENIARIKKTYTTHAYAIKDTVYDAMIGVLSTEKVDISISGLHVKFNCYVARPHVAWQRNGFSDILERDTNYHFLRD